LKLGSLKITFAAKIKDWEIVKLKLAIKNQKIKTENRKLKTVN